LRKVCFSRTICGEPNTVHLRYPRRPRIISELGVFALAILQHQSFNTVSNSTTRSSAYLGAVRFSKSQAGTCKRSSFIEYLTRRASSKISLPGYLVGAWSRKTPMRVQTTFFSLRYLTLYTKSLSLRSCSKVQSGVWKPATCRVLSLE
jgi:hypothetical protein